MRCLNAICEGGDARYRQVVASYYYCEIAERGAAPVLKEMALIAMHLASLNPVMEDVESDAEVDFALRDGSNPRSLFDREVAAVNRMIRGRRKSACFVQDEWAEWLNDLEANGATADELDDAFAHVEALDQYDEGGAIVRMSAHERTFACGRVDYEFTADDLPEHARFLAGDLLLDYVSGVEIAEIWDEVNAKLDILFPVKRKTTDGAKFFSRANLELQRLTRDTLEGILEECLIDYHFTAMRNNRSYRRFYKGIRYATDIVVIGALIKEAYEARQNGDLSVKHFIALNTAANNQRERLLSVPLSAAAYRLIEQIVVASEKKLGYLAWAMYGGNETSHPFHTLNSQEQTRVWEVMTARKGTILFPRFYARLCSTWGRALPSDCFIFLAVFKEFLQSPRLRKVLNVVWNKRQESARKPSSAIKPATPMRVISTSKRGAVVKSRADAAPCGLR
jgi:hypothetical protein